MSAADRLITEWTDIANGYLRQGNWLVFGSNPATLLADAAASTNGLLQFATHANATVGTVSPTDATYPLVLDLAQFNFSTAIGSRITFSIPAPLAVMFNPDGTVNPSEAHAAALIAGVLGKLADSANNPATLFLNGVKVSRRVEQNG